jgi:DNA-binding transcriptional LysR family regulator
MKNAITLDALRAIEAIHKQGSFAAAAKVLFKVPSALTYTVAKLESDLAVALFDRSKKRAVLTSAGKLVLEQGHQLLLATLALENAVQQLETGWETQLKITLDTLVPMPILFSLISEFDQLNKMTEISVNEEVLSGSWEALLSNQAQIVVGATGELPKGNFNVVEIAQAEFCFAVSANHELAEKNRIVTCDDIKKFTSIVVTDSATSTIRRTTGLLDSRRVVRVSNMSAKIHAQSMGLGIGFLPKHMITNELKEGTLVIKECEIPRQPEFIYMAWHKDMSGQALNWFVEKLQAVNWSAVFAHD